MPDIERVIMPGMLHWHSPQFHAYFAGATSYPSILADMLTDALGCMGISWASAPVLTELEVSCHRHTGPGRRRAFEADVVLTGRYSELGWIGTFHLKWMLF